ncbi:MAG TPA: hypothetical protein VFG53_11840 [Anaeromyxobacter sp.]|nr:hypothetical protein [Anaeromyxobacter sp.]
MRARFEVALRLAVACLALIGCGGGGGGGGQSGPSIAFTQGALKSVPLLRPPAPAPALMQANAAPLTPTSIDTDVFTAQLFKMECREAAGNQGVNYCPAGTPPQSQYGTTLGSDPYAFDMQALMGFIYAAQRETWLVASCSGTGLTPKTVTAGAYFAHSAGPGADPTRFIFDEYATYACRSSQVSDPTAETVVVSAAADGSYQTTLHTRYKYVAGGETQTDFTQVDVSMNSSTPEFLALNFASAEPLASRLVLLVNLTNHRFAMKYYTPQQPGNIPSQPAPERYAVAAGTAGYDLTSGDPNVGQYYLHFQDDPGEFAECVDNVTGTFETDFTACDAGLDHSAWSASAMQGFLGVPASAIDRLGPFLQVFGDTADLAVADGWASTTSQSADADLYWPAGLN